MEYRPSRILNEESQIAEQTHQEMLNILSPHGNANENYFEIPSCTCQND